jgi:hypothetical protein
MSRLSVSSLLSSLSAALVLGACSDATAPKSPEAVQPDAARQNTKGAEASPGFTLNESAVQLFRGTGTVGGTASVSKSSSTIDPAKQAFCFQGHCIQIVNSGTFVARVQGATRATGTGCGRFQLYINNRFARQTNSVCHFRGDILTTRYTFNRFFPRGTLFCEFARGPGVPHIGVCQRL